MSRPRNYKPLTDRHALFVNEYLVDLNAAGAAKRAGFNPKSGTKLLRQEPVRIAVDDAMRARSEATGITSEWVLREAVSLYQRCIQEIKPALHPKTRKQMRDSEGNPLFVFNAATAARTLELIGKHTTIGAWQDKVELSAPGMDIVSLLEQGRARVARQQTIDIEPTSEPVKQLPHKPRLPVPADGATLILSRKEQS